MRTRVILAAGTSSVPPASRGGRTAAAAGAAASALKKLRRFTGACSYTPSFFNASGGQPFQLGFMTLPMYFRSSTPILLDQKPDAVRSRKLLKKATPWLNSGFAF